jgi:hypothetical protein
MTAGSRHLLVALLGGVILMALACGSSDPLEDVLRERARWKVEVRSFVVLDDGSSRVTVQVAGPVKSSLEVLTVRVELVDAEGKTLHASWVPIDLSDVQRGVPAEKSLSLPAISAVPESVQVDPILAPTEQDIQHMPELSNLAPEA